METTTLLSIIAILLSIGSFVIIRIQSMINERLSKQIKDLSGKQIKTESELKMIYDWFELRPFEYASNNYTIITDTEYYKHCSIFTTSEIINFYGHNYPKRMEAWVNIKRDREANKGSEPIKKETKPESIIWKPEIDCKYVNDRMSSFCGDFDRYSARTNDRIDSIEAIIDDLKSNDTHYDNKLIAINGDINLINKRCDLHYNSLMKHSKEISKLQRTKQGTKQPTKTTAKKK